jgi:hypothetical protein
LRYHPLIALEIRVRLAEFLEGLIVSK